MADFSFVLSHLATGAALSSEADVDELLAAGVTAVIDCRDDFDDAPLFTNHPEINYLWNGTADDGQHKPTEWFLKSLQFGIPFLTTVATSVPTTTVARPKLYVHCAAGVNRGPSTAFAIMLALNWPADLAEAEIRKARPQVGLAYKQDAIDALTALGY